MIDRVIVGEYCKTTQVIDETLSPTWDELLFFEEILVYGRREDIKANPPTIIIEIYDQDKVSQSNKTLQNAFQSCVFQSKMVHRFKGHGANGIEWV